MEWCMLDPMQMWTSKQPREMYLEEMSQCSSTLSLCLEPENGFEQHRM